jgi:hypothetical protein
MRLLSSATLKIAGGSNLQPIFAHLAEARSLEDLVRLIVSSLVAKMYTEAPGPAGLALRYVSLQKDRDVLSLVQKKKPTSLSNRSPRLLQEGLVLYALSATGLSVVELWLALGIEPPPGAEEVGGCQLHILHSLESRLFMAQFHLLPSPLLIPLQTLDYKRDTVAVYCVWRLQ